MFVLLLRKLLESCLAYILQPSSPDSLQGITSSLLDIRAFVSDHLEHASDENEASEEGTGHRGSQARCARRALKKLEKQVELLLSDQSSQNHKLLLSSFRECWVTGTLLTCFLARPPLTKASLLFDSEEARSNLLFVLKCLDSKIPAAATTAAASVSSSPSLSSFRFRFSAECLAPYLQGLSQMKALITFLDSVDRGHIASSDLDQFLASAVDQLRKQLAEQESFLDAITSGGSFASTTASAANLMLAAIELDLAPDLRTLHGTFIQFLEFLCFIRSSVLTSSTTSSSASASPSASAAIGSSDARPFSASFLEQLKNAQHRFSDSLHWIRRLCEERAQNLQSNCWLRLTLLYNDILLQADCSEEEEEREERKEEKSTGVTLSGDEKLVTEDGAVPDNKKASGALAEKLQLTQKATLSSIDDIISFAKVNHKLNWDNDLRQYEVRLATSSEAAEPRASTDDTHLMSMLNTFFYNARLIIRKIGYESCSVLVHEAACRRLLHNGTERRFQRDDPNSLILLYELICECKVASSSESSDQTISSSPGSVTRSRRSSSGASAKMRSGNNRRISAVMSLLQPGGRLLLLELGNLARADVGQIFNEYTGLRQVADFRGLLRSERLTREGQRAVRHLEREVWLLIASLCHESASTIVREAEAATPDEHFSTANQRRLGASPSFRLLAEKMRLLLVRTRKALIEEYNRFKRHLIEEMGVVSSLREKCGVELMISIEADQLENEVLATASNAVASRRNLLEAELAHAEHLDTKRCQSVFARALQAASDSEPSLSVSGGNISSRKNSGEAPTIAVVRSRGLQLLHELHAYSCQWLSVQLSSFRQREIFATDRDALKQRLATLRGELHAAFELLLDQKVPLPLLLFSQLLKEVSNGLHA